MSAKDEIWTSAICPPPRPFQWIPLDWPENDTHDTLDLVCWPLDRLGSDHDPGDEDPRSVDFRRHSAIDARIRLQDSGPPDPWLDEPLTATERIAVEGVDLLREDQLLDLDVCFTPSADDTEQREHSVAPANAAHADSGALRSDPLQELFTNLAASLTPQQAEQLERPISEQQRGLFQQIVDLVRRDEATAESDTVALKDLCGQRMLSGRGEMVLESAETSDDNTMLIRLTPKESSC